MATSWHNFFFGAFDPAGTVTLDKLPGAFWIQAVFVHFLGFHPWVIVLPQVIEGVLTVLVLYRAVNRLMGPLAALLAALLMAASPAVVALDRGNISDTAMVLFLVLGADALSAAIVSGRQRKLVYAGIWVGIAFQAKMLEAWLVLPAFALAYLLGGPGSLGRKVRQAVIGGLAALLVSLCWMTVVTLVPASHRPYVDGSHGDSVYEQVFVYNGFGRVGQQTPLQLLTGQGVISATILGPKPGWNRLFTGEFGRDTGWLLPATLAVGIGGLFTRRRSYFVLWTGWAVALMVVFSFSTTINAYYTAALSPPVAAILGAAIAKLWDSRGRITLPTARLVAGAAAVVIAGTVAYCVWLLNSPDTSAPGWLLPLVVAVGFLAIALLALWVLPWAAGPLRGPLSATLTVVVLACALLIPATASAFLVSNNQGFGDTPFETAEFARGVDALLVSPPKMINTIVPRLEPLQLHAPYLMATYTSAVASLFITASGGKEVLPIGGFTGTIPSPTIAQLRSDIQQGKFHLVLGLSAHDPRIQWIASHCEHLGAVAGVYFCTPRNVSH